MGKIKYRPVYGRNKKLNGQGKALVQIEAYLSGRRAYFSTHIYLTPQQWSGKRCQVIRHPEADSLNYMLQEFVMNLEHKEMELWRGGVDVTLDVLKQAFRPVSSFSFLDFVKLELDVVSMKESSRKNLDSTWKLLCTFHPNLRFDGMTLRFVQEFERFMEGRGFSINTIGKHLKHLRTFVNWAIVKGRMKEEDYPFRRYRIKMGNSRHTYLTPEEMKSLEVLELTGEYRVLQHTLDAFLFCCYTGLRYSDFVHLTSKNMVSLEGKRWIVFSSVKTGVEVRLPVYLLFEGKACCLLDKYEGHWNKFFSLKSNTCVNHELHSIRKLAGIDKHFTFHCARHTNATLLIYQGANITTVQKLLGHRSVTTTQIYSEITGKTIVRDLSAGLSLPKK